MPTKMRRKALSVLSLVALAAILTGCGTQAATSSSIIATYKGGTVSRAEMDKQIGIIELTSTTTSLTPAEKKEVVETYITQDRLLVPMAEKAGIHVAQAKVEQEVDQLKASWITQIYKGSAQKFESKMSSLKLTDADLADAVRDALVLQGYAEKLIPASAARAYYNQNITQFATVTERAILVKTLPLAQQIRTMLLHGGSWDKLAKKYTLDTGSKNDGGLYSNQPASEWVPHFAQHAVTQPLKQIGQPFKTRYGYFVMQVLHRTIQPFASVQSAITEQLALGSANSAFGKLSTKVEKDAQIKVTLPKS